MRQVGENFALFLEILKLAGSTDVLFACSYQAAWIGDTARQLWRNPRRLADRDVQESHQ